MSRNEADTLTLADLCITHIECQINQNQSRSYLHHGDDKDKDEELDRHHLEFVNELIRNLTKA